MTSPENTEHTYPLWDWPVRIIHWLLVLCMPLAWWTASEQHYDWHARVGYTVLVLVTTRLVWGLVGSTHARFADFLVGPAAVLRYLKGLGANSRGHNPLGGWGVVLLLSLLLLQATSGLFNSDDILFNGPFYYAADGDFRDTMGVVHEYAFDVLLVMVGLHIAAVLFHQFKLGEKIVQAMIMGSAVGKHGAGPVRPLWRALLVAGLLAVILAVALAYAPKPQPMW